MLRAGTFLGNRYEIVSRIGSGGMSDVYKAKDLKLNRFVAIKVLKSEYSTEQNFVGKFRMEAQSAAGLSHPNIVSVYDVGEDRGVHYIVMELIEGITLKKYIERKKKLEIRESIEVAMQVARGIEAAHAQHIIHRDIKPQNIMISREGKVKVTDFGIARASSSQTISSNTMGSVHYISPEQARGGYCDERSDIYSLGITLYEMLTGRVPFEGDSTVAVALLHIQGEMVPPRQYEPLIPVSLEKIILKATQKKPELRYATATELIADLRKSLTAPNEDFVRISTLTSSSPTVVFSGDDREEINRLRGVTRGAEDYREEDRREDRRRYKDYDDYDDYEEESGSSVMEKVITALIVIAALAIVGGVAALVIHGIRTNPEEETTAVVTTEAPVKSTEAAETAVRVEMKNLLGMPVDEATKVLESQGLKYILEEGPSEVYEIGQVFEQEYKAGDQVEINTVVILKVSTGAENVQIPDTIIGMDEATARTTLRRIGLNVSDTSRQEPNNSIAPGTVAGTDPIIGSSLKKGATVTLILSMGTVQATTAAAPTQARNEVVAVPNLENYSLEDATAMLATAGLTVGSVSESYSSEAQKGKVISQSISGQSVQVGTSVNLVIGKGADPNEIVVVETQAPNPGEDGGDDPGVYEDGGDPDAESFDEPIIVEGVDD